MKTTLLGLVLLSLAFAARAGAAPTELSPEVLRGAKARIDSLLSARRDTTQAAADPANPFVLPASPVTAGEPVAPTPTNDVPLTKADTLTRLASLLKVTGYVQIQGVPHLVINRQAYRENDPVPVREPGGGVTFIRIKKITETDLTVELDDVELLIKHAQEPKQP